MGNALKDISAAIREAVRRGAVFTASIEHEPYDVGAVIAGPERVLTASHLVGDGGATVLLSDGTHQAATLVGRDPIHDLALLRLPQAVKAERLTPVAVAVGDLVVTLKRDSFDGVNAGLGMVSAAGARLRLDRGGALERYFQLDADRLVGSTGGPIVDAEGAFAGIQVFNRRMGAEVALPADLALARAALIEEKGGIRRPALGIKSQVVALSAAARAATPNQQESGLLLVWVESGNAADRAGLEVGDIVVAFGGQPVSTHEALVTLMGEKGAGAKVDIQFIHGGALRTAALVVGGA